MLRKVDLISRIKDGERERSVSFLLLIAGVILVSALSGPWKLTCIVPWAPAAIWVINALTEERG